MKIFIPETEENTSVFLSGEDARHLFAHRPQPGDPVFCGDGQKNNYNGRIEKITKDGVYILIEEKIPFSRPKAEITLFAALLKSDKNEFVIQKSTELGVSKIVFFESDNCVMRLDKKKKDGKKERFEKIARQAAMQCGRDTLPEIGDFTDFDGIFDTNHPVFFYENAKALGKPLFSEYLKNNAIKDRFSFIVGPEGGFSEKEVKKALEKADTVSLGERILRAETVPIAVLSVIAAAVGEM